MSYPKDIKWALKPNPKGVYSYEQAELAILMDIRCELGRLNSLLHCSNFTAIPAVLRQIEANTTRRKPKRKPPIKHGGGRQR